VNQGILYILWDNRTGAATQTASESYEELVCSVHFARKEGLPIALITDSSLETPYIDKQLFDYVITHDFSIHRTERSNALFRKSFMYDLTPFDETLYLDSDCVINDGTLPTNSDYPPQNIQPKLEFGFERASRHGICIAHDGHVMGQQEYKLDPKTNERTITRVYPVFADKVKEILGRSDYLPCFNSGVVFFNKTVSGVKQVFDLAKDFAANSCCNDQVALTISMEKLRFQGYQLHERVWNCRILPNRRLPWPGVKISHNQYWRAYYKQSLQV
jgi:hypothetical protein